MLNKGVITISVEIELAWGMHDKSEFSHLSHERTAEDAALSYMLKKCDKNRIPITFNVVGHLLRKQCTGSHGNVYPHSWWINDPGTNFKKSPLFYAPDMIRSILNKPTEHEICTHTFSHVLSNNTCEDVLRYDLKKAKDIHDMFGLEDISSIVMPRHNNINSEILSDLGISNLRSSREEYRLSRIRKYSHILAKGRKPRHPPCKIIDTGNIVETTCSPNPTLTGEMLPMGQKDPPLYWQVFPKKVRENVHRRYLIDSFEFAADTKCHIHLWSHLYNFANDSQLRAIGPALDRLGELQACGDLEVRTMCNLQELL